MIQPMRHYLRLIAITSSVLWCASALADTISVTFDESVRSEPATGRVMLFFITETGPEWSMRKPISGPFFEAPQPITSVGVKDWKPGVPVLIDSSVFAFPSPLDQLDGHVRVQAVLDLADNPERSHEDGPGNLFSEVRTIHVASDREDNFWIELTNQVEPRTLPSAQDNLQWVSFRSERLSDFYGRAMFHRAGVALPPGYLDDDSQRTEWPVVFVIPGYGGREDAALVYSGLFRSAASGRDPSSGFPSAVVIVLDPESPLGHHGFTDSPNHGPRGTALVREFIPYLESQFKLAARPEGRILTGHSSGGWTSLWLQLNWPDVFGATWSSSPDPIDFSAFQLTNLYEDENMYVMSDGVPTASHREIDSDGNDRVTMTVRQEALMEHAIHPLGGSGQQWDAWMAMYSPRNAKTGFPARLFDPITGSIDREVVEHWRKFDIAAIVTSDWDRYAPIVDGRIRLVCGGRDSFFLERAVMRFKEKIDDLRGDSTKTGDGYIMLIDDADHNTIMYYTQRRWNREMRQYLQKHGLHD
jgi:hypothetical protein